MTIGNFDGVHRGHRALLDHARSLDRGPVVAYTFHPAPVDVLRPEVAPRRLQTLDDRVDRLHRAGADHVVVEAFDISFGQLSPQAFADQVLVSRLRATAVVVGWDFRYGRARAGDASTLAAHLEVPVSPVEAVVVGGAPLSSSRIRALVLQGDVVQASALLGTPVEVVGTVVHGDARGRLLGFPTANLRPDALSPGPGVYAVTATSRFGVHRGVANLGHRPTFEGSDEFRVEVHLFDFDGDLYGERLRVAVHHRIRGERAFEGVEALTAQIGRDAETARALLA